MDDKPLPYPGAASNDSHDSRQHHPPQEQEILAPSPSRSRPSEEFYSTTTRPLNQPHDHARTPSTSSGSVLNRPRPKAARPNSFFGAVDEPADGAIGQDGAGGDWNSGAQVGAVAADWRGRRSEDSDGEGPIGGGARGHASSYYTAGGVRSASPGVESSYGELVGGSGPSTEEGVGQRGGPSRSSFYGLEAPGGQGTPYSTGHSSRAPTPSSSSLRPRVETSSASNSFSSSDAPRPSASHSTSLQPHHARYSSAPLSASRSASIYGVGNSPYSASPLDGLNPAPAPLLDQSHLRPGALASLLTHEKTLDLYRANAKKTNDPDIQFEFATFVMEVVGEAEAAALEAEAASGQRLAGNTEQELAARHKQQALVSESVSLLSKLAGRGHVKSQYFLADCYTQGVGTAKGKRDYGSAFPLFILASKHGHSDACYRAAQCCENAWGTKKDQGKAVMLLRRAAVLNHPAAMHRLGLAEINGELGLSKRPKEGVKWLKRAAELADQVDPPQPQSLHELAVLHEKGIENVIFQDEEYAAELLARAAELQFAPSAYKLGECYEYGKMGCPQDAALSIHYYNIAAQQNHREACFSLTAWYLVGSPGVLPQSDTEAYLWAKKAADLDLAKAEYAVGYFTEVGIGTHQDAREAIEWFQKAASHGDKRAMDRLRMAGQSHSQPFARPQPHHGNSDVNALPPPLPYKPPNTTKMTKKQVKANAATAKARGRSEDRGRPADLRQQQVQQQQHLGHQNPPRQQPPPLHRQRSASQPDLYQQQQHWAEQQPRHPSQPYPREVDPYAARLPPPVEPRMPMRQQESPPLDTAVRNDRVLQRRKGAGEDKDCVVM